MNQVPSLATNPGSTVYLWVYWDTSLLEFSLLLIVICPHVFFLFMHLLILVFGTYKNLFGKAEGENICIKCFYVRTKNWWLTFQKVTSKIFHLPFSYDMSPPQSPKIFTFRAQNVVLFLVISKSRHKFEITT